MTIHVIASFATVDDRRTDGRIIRFLTELAGRFKLLTDEPVEISLDTDLHSRSRRTRPQALIERSDLPHVYLIAFVSPAFIKSPYCRDTLSEFANLSNSEDFERRPRVICLDYIPLKGSSLQVGDRLVDWLANEERISLTHIRWTDPDSPEFQYAVQDVALRILDLDSPSYANEKITHSPLSINDPIVNTSVDSTLIDLEANLHSMVRSLEEAASLLGELLGVTSRYTDRLEVESNPDLRLAIFTDYSRAVDTLASSLQHAADQAESSTVSLSRLIDAAFSQNGGSLDFPDEWRNTFRDLSRVLDSAITESSELRSGLLNARTEISHVVDLVGVISQALTSIEASFISLNESVRRVMDWPRV